MNIKNKMLLAFMSLAVIILIAGGLGILQLNTLYRQSYSVGIVLAPQGDACMEIKLISTEAHLIFEEIMAGDTSENMEHVRELFDEVRWYINALLKGGTNDEGTFYKLTEQEDIELLKKVSTDFEDFAKSAEERYKTRSGMSGIGSGIDQEFDDLYEEIQAQISALVQKNSDDIEIVSSAGQAKYLLANGHLFLEELLAGDEVTNINEIKGEFQNAKMLIEQIGVKTGDPALFSLVTSMMRFIDVSEKRYDTFSAGEKAGSDADLLFDAKFHDFHEDADAIETRIHDEMHEHSKMMVTARVTGFIILIFATLLSIVIAILIAFIFSSYLSKNIAVIRRRARDIELGKLNSDVISISSKDELGELAGSFTQMEKAIRYKAQILEKIAGGNLNVHVKLASDDDALGLSMQQTAVSLSTTLSQVKSATDQFTASAGQVSSASQTLSQGASEQAASIEEISSSVTQMNTQTKQNAENAVNANALAKQAMDNAENGNGQMNELVSAMEEINKSSEEIKKIVKVIDDIAFQTNLLALNANVEAARAGKYGKGFAVVADEVRNLAAKSATAVKETTKMIDDSIKSIENGSVLVEKTSSQLDEIVNSVSKVADFIDEITSASREQAQGLDQINTSVEQVSRVVQSNSANAEETAAASEELAAQAEHLKNMLLQFQLDTSVKSSEWNAPRQIAPQRQQMIIGPAENFSGSGDQKMNGEENNGNPKIEVEKTGTPNSHIKPEDIINLDDQDFEEF